MEITMDTQKSMDTQSMINNIATNRTIPGTGLTLRKLGLLVCICSTFIGVMYAVSHSASKRTENQTGVMPEFITVKDENSPDTGKDDQPLAVAQDTPTAQPAGLVKPTSSRKKRAAPKYGMDKTKAATARAARIERFDRCSIDCDTRDPLLVEASNIIQAGSVHTPPVSDPKATSFGLSVLRSGHNLLGQALDTPEAVLRGGKQALYTTVKAIW
jgi:hypothetical protein